MSDLKRFFKHSSIYAIGNIINRIGAFLLLPVYTNYLSVSEYGTLELFYVVMSVVSGILAIGMAHATLRFYYDFEELSERNASISTNFIGSFVVTLAGVLFVALFTDQISASVFDSDKYNTGIYIILVTLVLELSSQICLAYVRALEYSMFFVIISIAKLIIQVSVNTYLVIVEGAGVEGVLAGNLITVFVGWSVLTYFTLSRCGFKFHMAKFIPVLRYCLPFLLSTLLGLIATNVDKFVLNYLVSLKALGIYALALKFSMIIEQLIGEPFSRSYGAFRYTIMKDEGADKMQADIVKYLFIVAVFSALGMSYFVRDILVIMSDEAYWGASEIVPIIMLSAIIKIMTYPAQTGILFAKQTKYFFYITAITAVVGVVGSYVLIDNFGLVGACMSLVVTESVALIVTHNISQRFFNVSYDYSKFIIILVAAIVFYLPAIYLTEYSLLISIFSKLLLLSAFVVFIYLSPVLTKEEVIQIRGFIGRKLSKGTKN
jgi:O-antigen/teichoic acid export membrane protein